MHPYQVAEIKPDHPAIIVAETGETVTYAQLEDRSSQGAQLLRHLGLKPQDNIALLLRNSPQYLEIYWASHRAGLYITPVSTHLKTQEVAYILNDCNATILIVSADLGETVVDLIARRSSLIPNVKYIYTLGERLDGVEAWEEAVKIHPTERITDEVSGTYMVYSSGSTGRPKGVVLHFEPGPIEENHPNEGGLKDRYGADGDSVYLCCGPLYHAAPLVSSTSTHRLGATLILMLKFDAERALQAIEKYTVTHAQFVPTMFVRFLKLPENVRLKYDCSSLKVAIHAAAPCPVDVKHAMLKWWGPIIHEYYSGSEANGQCYISPDEWLKKPGSVGQCMTGKLHICDDDGNELPAGETGLIYFEGGMDFSYRNDPEKTKASRHPTHPEWSKLGDVGHMDEDGYLFLTDRKDFTIISGGVNIYPRAAEDILVQHPKVIDVAVIGVPHEEFGEEVKAVVEPAVWDEAGPDLESELIAYCRSQISHIASPRSVDFIKTLPRMPSGKLSKKTIQDMYKEQS